MSLFFFAQLRYLLTTGVSLEMDLRPRSKAVDGASLRDRRAVADVGTAAVVDEDRNPRKAPCQCDGPGMPNALV